jgi:L-amino acid N-acyltransferase YncA
MSTLNVRHATLQDLKSILRIYNQGIEDRIATLETEEKDSAFMEGWFQNHRGRYSILVAVREDEVIGYRQVGVFEKQGVMDGAFIDVLIMEKLL